MNFKIIISFKPELPNSADLEYRRRAFIISNDEA